MNIGGLMGALLPVFFVLALGYFAGSSRITSGIYRNRSAVMVCFGGGVEAERFR